jgi:glycosyltransferase involved in cell wall biosynthesis
VSRGLAERHEVTLLTQRIDEGRRGRLTDSLRPPPTFGAFDDGGVAVVPLRFTRAQRLRMVPTIGQVVPGVRRFAYGRLRVPMAMSYASVVAPIIAERAAGHDVIHVWADGFLALAGVHAATRIGLPVLVTPFVHRGQWGDDPASALAYRGATRVIGLLDDDCQVLRDLGVAEWRVKECPACSPGVERGGGISWRREHRVEGALVVFLGVRRPYKGFDLLLAALPELGRRLPSVTVAFAGPGAPIAGEHSVRVIDRGVVSDDERAALLEAADVLCLPSSGEIFPVAILEAWSAETAVLTSDIPPLAELMGRSGGGIAVPRKPDEIAAGLVSILTGPKRELALAGYRYWRSHATVEAVVERHLELYRDAIAERPARGSLRRDSASPGIVDQR